MPSINTGGFQATVMPGIQYLAPQQFTPNYGSAIPDQATGADYYKKLKDIANEEQMAPLRKRLTELSIAQGEQGLLNTKQQAAFGHEVITSEDFLDASPGPNDTPATEEGEEPQKAWGNLYKVTKGYRIGPGGIMEPFERKTVVEDANDRRLKALQYEALAKNRLALGDAAGVRAEAAQQRVDEQGKRWRKIGQGIDPATNMLVVIEENAAGEQRHVSPNLYPVESAISSVLRGAIGGPPAGNGGIQLNGIAPSSAALNVINPKPGMFNLDVRTPEVRALDAPAQVAPVAQPLDLTQPSKDLPVLTVQQAAKAPVGTKFMGIDGKPRIIGPDGKAHIIGG